MAPKPQLSAQFYTLFGVPFLAAGAWGVFSFLQLFAEGSTDLKSMALWAILALVFGGGGCGVIWLGRFTARKAAETSQLKQTYPEQPWIWQADWAAGRISGGSQATVRFPGPSPYFGT